MLTLSTCPQTNCLTEPLFDRALARAGQLDAHFAATGKVVGPLHGLPVSLKEQFDIEGVESTMGASLSASSATPVSLERP